MDSSSSVSFLSMSHVIVRISVSSFSGERNTSSSLDSVIMIPASISLVEISSSNPTGFRDVASENMLSFPAMCSTVKRQVSVLKGIVPYGKNLIHFTNPISNFLKIVNQKKLAKGYLANSNEILKGIVFSKLFWLTILRKIANWVCKNVLDFSIGNNSFNFQTI